MKNPICISTGCVYKISTDMNEKVQLLRGFPSDGIELCFSFAEDVRKFEPSKEN